MLPYFVLLSKESIWLGSSMHCNWLYCNWLCLFGEKPLALCIENFQLGGTNVARHVGPVPLGGWEVPSHSDHPPTEASSCDKFSSVLRFGSGCKKKEPEAPQTGTGIECNLQQRKGGLFPDNQRRVARDDTHTKKGQNIRVAERHENYRV